MPIEITMPRLSDTMEVGTILNWHVHAGDVVASGDLLADIETDKATMELQSFDDGTIEQLIVEEGQQVSVGTIIATILEEDEDSSDSSPDSISEPVQTPEPAHQSHETHSTHSGPRVSPIARRLAEEYEIDLQTIQGSGPSGRIIKRDVLQVIDTTSETTSAANTTKDAPTSPVVAGSSTSLPVQPLAPVSPWQQDRTVPLSNVSRQVIAKKLVESKQTIPHYQVTMSFDMDPLT